MKISARSRAELFLLSMSIVWGSTFVFVKLVLIHASPFVYTAVRFAAAALIFALLFFRRLKNIDRTTVLHGGLLGIFLFVGIVLQTEGLRYTSASKSAFITGMMVVFTPILQLFIDRRLPQIGNIVGVFLVVAGLYYLTSPQGSEFNRGDLMSLSCALSFALYLVYLGMFGEKYDPFHLTLMQFLTAALFSVPFIFIEHAYLTFDGNSIPVLLYLAVMPTIVALYIQTKYQKDTTPTRCAVIASLEPPIAALFAAVILGESLGIAGIAGGALILIGVLVSEFSEFLFKNIYMV
ncbi:MAG: DMT family transporter [Bacteroidota bacterium]